MTIEKLYDICCESVGCTFDIETYIIDGQVWQFDLAAKHIRHRDGTHTYFGAYLMTEKDIAYDQEFGQYYLNDDGTRYKLRVDENGKIISKRKARG